MKSLPAIGPTITKREVSRGWISDHFGNVFTFEGPGLYCLADETIIVLARGDYGPWQDDTDEDPDDRRYTVVHFKDDSFDETIYSSFWHRSIPLKYPHKEAEPGTTTEFVSDLGKITLGSQSLSVVRLSESSYELIDDNSARDARNRPVAAFVEPQKTRQFDLIQIIGSLLEQLKGQDKPPTSELQYYPSLDCHFGPVSLAGIVFGLTEIGSWENLKTSIPLLADHSGLWIAEFMLTEGEGVSYPDTANTPRNWTAKFSGLAKDNASYARESVMHWVKTFKMPAEDKGE